MTFRYPLPTRSLPLAFALAATLFLFACNQAQTPPPAAESKAAVSPAKDVFVVFEGPWAFAPDPRDANSVLALAPKTSSHYDLRVQHSTNSVPSGVYDLLLPSHSGSAAAIVDPNILRAKIDPSAVQQVVDAKSGRYAIRLPKPEEYLESTHYRARTGTSYPPDASGEKDWVTSVSLRYSVPSGNGITFSGTPDAGEFKPLLIGVKTPTINFVIEPSQAFNPNDQCFAHAREAFHDLTKLIQVTLFVDFPGYSDACHAYDPQKPHRAKAVQSFGAGISPQQMFAAISWLFAVQVTDCGSPIIVNGG